MKLKRLPEDFLVEERLLIPLTDPRALPTSDLDCDDSQAQGVSSGSESSLGQTSSDQPIARGEFVLYRLTKIGLGTPEALEAIRRRWNLPRASLSVGGLKDRHARTIQYLTIRRGPWRRLRQSRLELVPVGTMSRPYGPRDFAGNRFSLVLRDLDRDALERAKRGLESLERDGLPNYFDDQRFGSVGFTGEFQPPHGSRGITPAPCGWRSPRPTRLIVLTRAMRKNSFVLIGATGLLPRQPSHAVTPAAWSPTWSITRRISGALSPVSGMMIARSPSRRFKVIFGTSRCKLDPSPPARDAAFGNSV